MEDPSTLRVSSSAEVETTIRSRGGYRDLHTIPVGVNEVRARDNADGQPILVLTNYVRIQPMKEREIYQYRVDFEPNIESVSLRRRLFAKATESNFSSKVIFDGTSDARSSHKTQEKVTKYEVEHPTEPATKINITVKLVGTITWGHFEMIRVYNMNMKAFLRALGFYQISRAGAYVHPQFATNIGSNENSIAMVRGYRTAANVHEDGHILMNLESVHKIMQSKNVLQVMSDIRARAQNFKEAIRAQLTGKLVVPSYNKIVYKIEDVKFDMTPKSTFPDRRTGGQLSYLDYYNTRYGVKIADPQQPLLLVTQNNRRQRDGQGDSHDIYLVPEMCNIAGLTDSQRNDNRLKMDLIRGSQIDPAERVKNLNLFLQKFHNCNEINETLNRWGYSYGKEPVEIRARIMPTESIGIGRSVLDVNRWPKVDGVSASFDSIVLRESLAKAPTFPKMVVIVPRSEFNNQGPIVTRIKQGFDKIGLNVGEVQFVRMEDGDGAHHYIQTIRRLPPDTTATLVMMSSQNKEKYDAIKKVASVELGLITQVVTSRLMMDQRKAGGAAVKIGLQIAAKVGGEPWYVNLPLADAMVCGYDTNHDTSNRGRSFGAFIASMNSRFSRWVSKADMHDRLEELSSHLSENLTVAIRRYQEANGKLPHRVFIYRDGVGDGHLEHVFNVELKQVKKAIKQIDERIRLCVIVVNKRIGARFYMKNNNTYKNPPPGTVIDNIVTRKERYDFYLVSQSTRNGTVSPTYYNIIHDESGLDAAKHQAMAYKMCFLYYNWSGTVRVPAPCQYAHKLAFLCGEHLHAVPSATLDDRLHFL